MGYVNLALPVTSFQHIFAIYMKMRDMEKVDLEGSATQVPSLMDNQASGGQAHTQDAVFGEMTDKGPNYRNVRAFSKFALRRTDLILGRMDGIYSGYVEDYDWAWGARYPVHLQYLGNSPRCNHLMRHRYDHYMVRLCSGDLQAASSHCL